METTNLVFKDGQVFHKNGVCLGDILAGDDGYYAWWPNESRKGCFPSYILKDISDLLDDLNHDWDLIIKTDVSIS